jgi:hypothetical protein
VVRCAADHAASSPCVALLACSLPPSLPPSFLSSGLCSHGFSRAADLECMKGSLVDAMGQAIDNAEVNLHALYSINVRYLADYRLIDGADGKTAGCLSNLVVVLSAGNGLRCEPSL